MIKVGIVGLGFMGMVHYLTYRKLPGVRVAAICDGKDRRLSGDWSDIQGNFGPSDVRVDLSGVETFTNFDEMLQGTDLDLVDVTLPPALHAAATISALNKGRHVFCEKPMSLTLADCDSMLRAANDAGRQLYVGHVLPYFPEYAWALACARSGRFGQLRGGQFHRVIADPLWNQRFWSATDVGGPLFDLHVHDAHLIRLLFGVPSAVVSRGRCRGDLPEYWTTQFAFEGSDYAVAATSGVLPQQGRSFTHGFEIHFEKATLLFDFAVMGSEGRYLCPPTILNANGGIETVELGSGDPMDAFEAELGAVLDCVKHNRTSETLSGELARDAIEICNRQRASLLSQRGRKAAGDWKDI